MRHQENIGEAHLSAADKEASQHFSYVAATPPHEEGTISDSLTRLRFL